MGCHATLCFSRSRWNSWLTWLVQAILCFSSTRWNSWLTWLVPFFGSKCCPKCNVTNPPKSLPTRPFGWFSPEFVCVIDSAGEWTPSNIPYFESRFASSEKKGFNIQITFDNTPDGGWKRQWYKAVVCMNVGCWLVIRTTDITFVEAIIEHAANTRRSQREQLRIDFISSDKTVDCISAVFHPVSDDVNSKMCLTQITAGGFWLHEGRFNRLSETIKKTSAINSLHRLILQVVDYNGWLSILHQLCEIKTLVQGLGVCCLDFKVGNL